MYYLMNKDNITASFSLGDDDLHTVCLIDKVTGNLPIGFTTIDAWIKDRRASVYNGIVNHIMRETSYETAKGFIDMTHAISINDTFWIKSNYEPDITWEQVSPYSKDNQFNETVSKSIFLEDYYRHQENDCSYPIVAPELTAEGSYARCFVKGKDNIYLYKRGSSGASNSGREPYCEMLASELAQKICKKKSVIYDFATKYEISSSKCRLFTDEQYGFVPYSRICKDRRCSLSDILTYFEDIGYGDEFRRMIVFDSVVFNTDRHMGNYGIIIDNDTLEPLRMAPVFDFNLSLFPCSMREDYDDINKIMPFYCPSIGDDFISNAKAVMTDDIMNDLKNLEGFRFLFRGDSIFETWRIEALEDMIDKEISAIEDKTIFHIDEVFLSDIQKDLPEESMAHD